MSARTWDFPDGCGRMVPYRKSDSAVLVRASGSSGVTVGRARFYVPSAEMNVSYSVGLLSTTEVAPEDITAGAALIDVYPRHEDPNRAGGKIRLPLVRDDENVPAGIELLGSGPAWYELVLTTDQSVYAAVGDWVLIVNWELTKCIEPSLRPILFALAELQCSGPSAVGMLG